MPSKAMTLASDSSNPPALSCSPDERPPVTVSAMGQGYLAEELDTARRNWIHAVSKIPAKWGPRRVAAISKVEKLKRRYEQLLGHPVGKPDEQLPMDGLPHIEIKKL